MRAIDLATSPPDAPSVEPPRDQLFLALLTLALPVLAENALNIVVGLNDAYLANHLPSDSQSSTAAVGTVAYLLWFIGLFSGALGTGATAIISRAIGARHRARAHAACGQAMLLAATLGLILGAIFLFAAPAIASLAGLHDHAHDLAVTYLRLLSPGAPFLVVLFVANASLRGAGDTRTPMLAMAIVNTINVTLTWSLTFGYLGLPALGIRGIAIGTAIAYAVGAVMQTSVLLLGIGKLKLRMHRLRFHQVEMSRLLRIGAPSAAENAMMWGVNFFLVHTVNGIGEASSAAHLNSIRIESVAFMTGFAVAVAVSTLVGQSLGQKNPARARRAAYYGYALAGGAMTLAGLSFILFNHAYADAMSPDPEVRALTARCLFICGFTEWAFAAFIIFSAALRGAGDTKAVMYINIFSVVGIRLAGVIIVGVVFHASLPTIWIVLSSELMLRGAFAYTRFRTGKWQHVKV